MSVRQLIPHLSRKPERRHYLLAVALAVAAVFCRALLALAAPGIAYFILLFPAVVMAGVFLGTAPAVLAAAVGGGMAGVLFFGSALLQWPPFNAAQIDVVLLLPTCGTIIWATHALRRAARIAGLAEARLQEVVRQIPGAAAVLEAPSGRLLARSAASEAVLGHTPGRAERSGDLASYGGFHPDGRPYAPEEYPIVRALRTGEIVQGEALAYRRPDGRLIDLEVHAGPVHAPDGHIVAAVGMAFDVSERVAAGRRLLDSEARHRAAAQHLRAAIDAAALGVWELDLATGRISLDATCARMLGLPPEAVEMERAALRRFVDPSDQPRTSAVLDGAIVEGGTYADELHMRTVRGEERWLVTRGAVLADAGKVVGVINDVTERRQREDALAAALHARDVLMYEADHRIKNSLQLVVSLLELQLNRVADPDARHSLGAAISRVQAIANAHLALQRSPDLCSLEIDRMLGDLCSRMASLNPSVRIECRARSGLVMDADQAIPLGLIASELLTNALRHAYPPAVEGTVTLAVGATEGRLEMTVADSGAGLAATPIRRGLGTTLVASMTRQIDATVETTSRPGQGTTVVVRLVLPAAATGNSAVPDTAAAAPDTR